jgi:hypothetical protein
MARLKGICPVCGKKQPVSQKRRGPGVVIPHPTARNECCEGVGRKPRGKLKQAL